VSSPAFPPFLLGHPVVIFGVTGAIRCTRHGIRRARSDPWIRSVAAKWRSGCVEKRTPKEVARWWKTVVAGGSVALVDLHQSRYNAIVDALLSICATADTASAGIGINEPEDPFLLEADRIFKTQYQTQPGLIRTVCQDIDPSAARILPKLHTPKSGLTIRSLSHS
jgi:hypothetical protein